MSKRVKDCFLFPCFLLLSSPSCQISTRTERNYVFCCLAYENQVCIGQIERKNVIDVWLIFNMVVCSFALQKSIKIHSSLTWCHSKRCKICVLGICKISISLLLSLRSSHSGKFPKYSCHQKQPWGCIFQYRCSALIVKFFEKLLWRSAIFSKLAYNTLQLWTTAAEL